MFRFLTLFVSYLTMVLAGIAAIFAAVTMFPSLMILVGSLSMIWFVNESLK